MRAQLMASMIRKWLKPHLARFLISIDPEKLNNLRNAARSKRGYYINDDFALFIFIEIRSALYSSGMLYNDIEWK